MKIPAQDDGQRFLDPSDSDSVTLAVVHREDRRAVLDLLREWPSPCSPHDVVREIVTTLAPGKSHIIIRTT